MIWRFPRRCGIENDRGAGSHDILVTTHGSPRGASSAGSLGNCSVSQVMLRILVQPAVAGTIVGEATPQDWLSWGWRLERTFRYVKFVMEIQKVLSSGSLSIVPNGPAGSEGRGLDPDQSDRPTIEAVLLIWRWPMRLSSSAFSSGATIPRRFTCDGEDLSPPCTGRPYRRRPAVSSFPVTIRMRPQANGTIGPPTTFLPTKQELPKASAATAARRASSRPSMTSIRLVTAFPARPAAMGVTVITFVCWLFRSIACRSAPSPPAARSSVRHVSMSSPKRPSWGSISDDLSHSRGF